MLKKKSYSPAVAQMLEIGIQLGCAESVEEITKIVMNMVSQLMPYDRASISLINPKTQMLEIQKIKFSSRFFRDKTAREWLAPHLDRNFSVKVMTLRKDSSADCALPLFFPARAVR